MREIVAKIVVMVDGVEYILKTCDYSETIKEAIDDNQIEDNIDEIIEYINSDGEF